MSAAVLAPFIDADRDRVDDALDRALRLDGSPARLADPIRYAVRGGGKRLRPVLCAAAYRAVRADPPAAAYDLGAAIELIHAYSLVHDDLPAMDDDDLRRGRPATHLAHGVAAATIAGAALIALAFRTAAAAAADLGLDGARRAALLRALAEAAGAGGMIGGQVLDLEAEGGAVSVPELEAIHKAKTGALLAGAARVGGLAAGATAAQAEALARFGIALGLAFQIMDDILDLTGTSDALGKTAGRDAALAKATYPSLLGLAGARRRAEEAVAEAVAALSDEAMKTDELRALARYAVDRDR